MFRVWMPVTQQWLDHVSATVALTFKEEGYTVLRMDLPFPAVPVSLSTAQLCVGSDEFTFTADASELGWPPGFFPKSIRVADFGNGQPLNLVSVTPERALYSQDVGCLDVLIFND